MSSSEGDLSAVRDVCVVVKTGLCIYLKIQVILPYNFYLFSFIRLYEELAKYCMIESCVIRSRKLMILFPF